MFHNCRYKVKKLNFLFKLKENTLKNTVFFYSAVYLTMLEHMHKRVSDWLENKDKIKWHAAYFSQNNFYFIGNGGNNSSLEKVANDLLAEMMRSEMMRSDWLIGHGGICWLVGCQDVIWLVDRTLSDWLAANDVRSRSYLLTECSLMTKF